MTLNDSWVRSPVRKVDETAENASFADWFVLYVTTANPSNTAAEADFRLIVGALVKWCVDHFDAAERANLAARLDSAADQASSAIGRELAQSAAKALTP